MFLLSFHLSFALLISVTFFLVPRPLSVFHLGQSVSGHVVRAKRRPFASDPSPKRIDLEGLGESRTGTRQCHVLVLFIFIAMFSFSGCLLLILLNCSFSCQFKVFPYWSAISVGSCFYKGFLLPVSFLFLLSVDSFFVYFVRQVFAQIV